MKKHLLFAAMLCCLALPKLPVESIPIANEISEPTAFVVDAGHYAWAWAEARYYSCYSASAKELF